jgi:hypothetical protein
MTILILSGSDGENLNEQLMENNLGIIDTRFVKNQIFQTRNGLNLIVNQYFILIVLYLILLME